MNLCYIFVCLPKIQHGHWKYVVCSFVTCYLIFLFAVTFGMMNSMSYYFTNAVMEAFVNEHTDVHNPDSSFREIDGADDWYNVST